MKEDMVDEIKELTLTGMVKKVLLMYPQSRNDDQLLIDFVDQEYHHAFISKQGGIYTPPKHLTDRHRRESITRLKRLLMQHERDTVKNPEDWRIQPDKVVKMWREEQEQQMKHINEWWEPTLDGAHSKQTVLME